MEDDYNWHSKVMTDEDLRRALADLEKPLGPSGGASESSGRGA
jgi:hypothetical protein